MGTQQAKAGPNGSGVNRLDTDGILAPCNLPTDLQAPMARLLSQAWGVSYVHEPLLDKRLLYVSEVRKMGA